MAKYIATHIPTGETSYMDELETLLYDDGNDIMKMSRVAAERLASEMVDNSKPADELEKEYTKDPVAYKAKCAELKESYLKDIVVKVVVPDLSYEDLYGTEDDLLLD